MGFTATPLDGSSTPIPMPTVVPDGTNTPIVVEGGPIINTGGNNLAPVATQDIERLNYISLSSPPTQTNAGSDIMPSPVLFQQRNPVYVNPKDLQAQMDGVTDDTAFITAALTAVSSLG